MALYNHDSALTIWPKLFVYLFIPLLYAIIILPKILWPDISIFFVLPIAGCVIFTAGYVATCLENKASRLEQLNKPLSWIVYSCPYCGQEFDQVTCNVHGYLLCERCGRYYLFYDILSGEAYLTHSTSCSSKSDDIITEWRRKLDGTTSDECPWCGFHLDSSTYKSGKRYSCPDCSRLFVHDQHQFRRFKRRITD